MYAFKIVTTVFMAMFIAVLGFATAKAGRKSDLYVTVAVAVLQAMALVAIWM